MIERTDEEILAKLREMWPGDRYNGTEYRVSRNGSKVVMEVWQMYEFVPLGLAKLMELSEFFGTTAIDDEHYSSPGCESCDYGSQYTIELSARPE